MAVSDFIDDWMMVSEVKMDSLVARTGVSRVGGVGRDGPVEPYLDGNTPNCFSLRLWRKVRRLVDTF
jgi:hypothetical protein